MASAPTSITSLRSKEVNTLSHSPTSSKYLQLYEYSHISDYVDYSSGHTRNTDDKLSSGFLFRDTQLEVEHILKRLLGFGVGTIYVG